MTRLRFLIAFAALALLASRGPAHDLKVFASQLALEKPGGKVTIYLSWGDHVPVHDLIDATTLDRYDLLTPDGKTTALTKSDLSLQTNSVEIKSEGVSRVVAVRKPAIITFLEDKDGKRVIHHGGKSTATEGKIEQSLRNQQFATALILAGSPTKKDGVKPLGLPLEIVPDELPSTWRPGRMIRFKVLFNGKPLPEETLVATHVGYRPDDAWCFATTTDHDGIATVRATQAGTWLLRVKLKRPAAKEAQNEYDIESYTATLTLEIRP